MSVNGSSGRDDDVVVRRGEHGWVVGNENVSDLTSAMVLADLFAADQATSDAGEIEAVDGSGTTSRPSQQPTPASPHTQVSQPAQERSAASREQPASSVRNNAAGSGEAERLAVTVAQLEHALSSRVTVEQAIGVLAERHRLRPRKAFDLLRRAARSRGRRVTEIAQDVVASTANPLLQLPEELARAVPEPRQRGRSMRHAGRHAQRA
jgi:ANTAR domain